MKRWLIQALTSNSLGASSIIFWSLQTSRKRKSAMIMQENNCGDGGDVKCSRSWGWRSMGKLPPLTDKPGLLTHRCHHLRPGPPLPALQPCWPLGLSPVKVSAQKSLHHKDHSRPLYPPYLKETPSTLSLSLRLLRTGHYLT